MSDWLIAGALLYLALLGRRRAVDRNQAYSCPECYRTHNQRQDGPGNVCGEGDKHSGEDSAR